MNRIGYIGMGLALAIASTSAFAFQEEGGAASVAPAPDAKAAPSEPGLDFSAPTATGESSSVGTEVRIPGLGRLGVLPKMDFGLELLYGANEVKKREQDIPGEDLTIRGTVKHNF
ncbi:MAG TPA: hypothetical protein PK857_04965 [Hyphomicrobium sp.]|nr:hypothetical protein [Hyphomicrobium sp.]